MRMGNIKFKGEIRTWTNDREGEGFIQERLNRKAQKQKKYKDNRKYEGEKINVVF